MTVRSRFVRTTAAALALAVVALLVAAPASATGTYDEASWYYTNFNMAANLAVANGSGVSIALIDTSIDPTVPELANAKIQTQASQCLLNGSTDPVSSTTDATHGTQMAVMIAGNGTGTWDGRGARGVAPGATILHYRNQTDEADGAGTECRNAQGTDIFDEATADAIRDATAKGARIVNMSFGTDASMPLTAEAMGEAERQGVVFIGSTYDKATPNNPSRLNNPGQFNGVVLMNGLSPDSQPAPNSSTSDLVTLMAPGDQVVVGGVNPATGAWDSTGVFGGSSIAAAFTSGVVADAFSRWPQATGNQIIQLMLRTTGGTFHEIPTRADDGFGFGTVSLTTMFEHDPMSMPDQNPLLRDDAEPPTSDILGQTTAPASDAASSAAPTTSAGSATPTPQAAARGDGGFSLPLVLGIVAAVVVVLAVLVLVLVLVLRSRRRPPGGGAPPPVTGFPPPPPPSYGQPAR